MTNPRWLRMEVLNYTGEKLFIWHTAGTETVWGSLAAGSTEAAVRVTSRCSPHRPSPCAQGGSGGWGSIAHAVQESLPFEDLSTMHWEHRKSYPVAQGRDWLEKKRMRPKSHVEINVKNRSLYFWSEE